MAEKTYTLAQIKEMRELVDAFGLGEKHDTASTTPSAQALHGVNPGNSAQQGLFSNPGVRPGMYDATFRPRSFASMIQVNPNPVLNEKIEILTGVTAGSGNNVTGACAPGPNGGMFKTCQQLYTYGELHISTRIDDITKIGQRLNRADVDRVVYNNGLNMNPWLPNVPGIDGDGRIQSRTRASFYTTFTELERNVGQVMFAGVSGTADNTYRGVATQFAGLDGLIKTGYTDAVNGVACAAADSIVETFNAAIDGGTDSKSRTIIQAMTDAIYAAEDRGNELGISAVNRPIVMRHDLFRSLVDVWSCAYAVSYCTSSAAGQPLTRDATAVSALRDSMYTGRYLLIDGVQRPVFFDDSIPRQTLGNNYYQSDIYIPAVSWAGAPLLYAEYFPLDNAEANEFANFIGGNGMDTLTLNNGMWRAFKYVTGGCLNYDFYAKVRLILDAPFLSARVDNLFYKSYAQTRDAIPGFSNYNNGGSTYRLAGVGGAW